MSKLTKHDFKPTAVVSPDNDPNFKGVKAKFVPEEKLKEKLPEPVQKVYANLAVRHRYPGAWILKVKHKDHKAYAIVSRATLSLNEVRVLNKHGKLITKIKTTNYDSIDD